MLSMHVASRDQLAPERGHALERQAKWLQAQDLRADVHVQAIESHVGQFAGAANQRLASAMLTPNLFSALPVEIFSMRAGVDVRIDAHRRVRDGPARPRATRCRREQFVALTRR